MKRWNISFSVVGLLFSLGISAQPSANARAVLHQYLTIQQKRIGFNGVIMITDHAQVIFKEAIGKASIEMDVPLSTNSVFKIASVTKSFTALLTLLACEEGKLSLKDSLATFFPELKDAVWRSITIDQLLSHTSGIPHDEGIADYWTVKSLLHLKRQQALAEIFSTKLLFKPGTNAAYSSPGYFLLAVILENVYHESYADILKEKITNPLHMHETGIYNTQKIIPLMTSSYHLAGDSLIVAPYRDFSLMKGSGDMYATAEDMAKWLNSFSGSQWNDKIKTLIFTPHTHKSLRNNDKYGYRWYIRAATNGVGDAYYMGGGTYGCSAIAVWYPDQKMAVIILSNVSALPVNELWADIEKILFNRPFEMPVLMDKFEMTAEMVKQFAGSYISEPGGMELVVTASDNHLYVKLGNNPAFEIYPYAASKFYGKKVNIRLSFQIDQKGAVTGISVDGRGQVINFKKKHV